MRPSLETMARQYGNGSRLEDQAAAWPTPTTRPDSRNMGSNQARTPVPPCLEEAALNLTRWQTPQTRDWKNGVQPGHHGSSPLGLQAPRMLTDGPALSLPEGWGSSRLYLNPRFVEWLMGWPDEWTGSAPAEMASYLYRQRLQLAILLESWDGAGILNSYTE